MNSFSVVAIISANIEKYQKALSQVYDDTNKLEDLTQGNAQKMGKAFKSVGKALTFGLTAPLVGIGAKSVKTAAEFESAMSEVKAISGATQSEFVDLEKLAKEMGATTKFTAIDSAEALKYMGMAGWGADQMIAGLPPILDLAAASGEGLGIVSDIVTDSLTAFGLSADDASGYADILAATATGSNTNVGLMGETFKYVAPVAGALGYSVEDTALAIGLMANQGIKGGQAGTQLRTAFTRLVKPTKDVHDGLEMVGLSAEDFQGLSLKEKLDLLRESFQGLDGDQQAQIASMVFGQRAMSGMLGIINASEEDYNGLADAINNSTGAAKEMAAIMMDNLEGDLILLSSAVEGAALVIGEALRPAIREITQKIKDWVTAFNELDPATQEMIVKAGLFAAALGPVLWVIGSLMGSISNIIGGFKSLGGAIKKIVGHFGLASKGSALLGKAMAFLTSPIGIVIGIITALVGVVVYLWKTNENFRNKVIEIWTAVSEFFTNIWEDIKEGASDIWDSVKDKWQAFTTWITDTWTTITEFFSNLWTSIKEGASNIWESVKELWQSFVDWVIETWMVITEFFTDIWEDIKEGASNIWDSVKEVWTGFTEWIMEMWSGVSENLSNIWESIKSIASSVWELIKTVIITPIMVLLQLLIGDWEDAKNSLSQVWDNIKGHAKNIWENIKSIVSNLVEALVTTVKNLFTTMKDKVTSLSESAKEAVSNAWDKLKTAVVNLVENTKKAVTDKFNEIKKKVSDLSDKAKEAVSRAWENTKTAVSNIVENIKTTVSNKFNELKTSASNKANELKDSVSTAFSEMWQAIVDYVKEIPSKVAGAFTDAISDARSALSSAPGVGRDLILGFVQGVKNAAGRLVSAVTGAVSGAINKAKSLLGIRSPSRVFMQFGEYTNEGLALGITRTMKKPINAMDKMSQNVIDTFTPSEFDVLGGMSADDLNGAISSNLKLDGDSMVKPLDLTLNLGNENYKGFVSNIFDENAKVVTLEQLEF